MAKYEILDEPKPASYSHLASNPLWIFLATMLGGVWLGWTWSAFNSFAIGSAAKKKELSLIALGLVGCLALTAFGDFLLGEGYLEASQIKYAFTVLIVWKLSISYRLHLLQEPSFQLFEYFGGTPKNGLLLLFVGAMARPSVLEFFQGTVLYLVLA